MTMPENDPAGPEFDRYADKYTEMHRVSVQASGEEPAYFSAYKAKYMARRLGPIASAKALDILDFGCGVGNSIPPLRDAFPSARLFGSDPSGESVKIATERFSGHAQFRVSSDIDLPYADDSFDAALVACVYHHISPDARLHWTQELHRVLKPGGKLFIFEHNMLNPLTLKVVRECPFDEDAILLPKKELLHLSRAAGFGELRAQYVVFFPQALSIFRPLEPFMSWLPLGAQYVLEGTS
jgi:SAM-dependent methyltransferase